MKASIFISVIVHIALFLAFQEIFPLRWKIETFRSYRVELIRPPVEDIETGDIPGPRFDHLKDRETPPTDETQETVSLDTKDKRYTSYTSLIKREIMRRWTYPLEARERFIQGDLKVLFTLSRDGSLIQIRITETSGHEILDREVVRAIKTAVPFPPFPETIEFKRLNIKARFVYRLSSEQ